MSARLNGAESAAERVDALKSVVEEAVETLANAPRDRRLHRVLVRAYLAMWARAAEVLELPYSTFRRLLGAAVERVTTVMWHRELYG